LRLSFNIKKDYVYDNVWPKKLATLDRGSAKLQKSSAILLADTFYDDKIEWTVFYASIFFGPGGGVGGGLSN
jgi:hypothetical protein